eukprot:TRINITY_DN30430_c0_g1_i1.p1 TRINITY_DN30430_c0_g1~~TRINITY_DN30430_c0_g1_i1.p1  ORF type:complete len:289 (-),score=42.62 TRINITY_DN30430_c0_g1_i1:231-1097(-)
MVVTRRAAAWGRRRSKGSFRAVGGRNERRVVATESTPQRAAERCVFAKGPRWNAWRFLHASMLAVAAVLLETATSSNLGFDMEEIDSGHFTDPDLDLDAQLDTVILTPAKLDGLVELAVADRAPPRHEAASNVHDADNGDGACVDVPGGIAGGGGDARCGNNDTDLGGGVDLSVEDAVLASAALAPLQKPATGLVARRQPVVTDIRFKDLDLDPDDIGGPITWVPPADTEFVTHYTVYLAASASSQDRRLVGSDVLVGTNWLMIPADTPARDSSGVRYDGLMVHVGTS